MVTHLFGADHADETFALVFAKPLTILLDDLATRVAGSFDVVGLLLVVRLCRDARRWYITRWSHSLLGRMRGTVLIVLSILASVVGRGGVLYAVRRRHRVAKNPRAHLQEPRIGTARGT